MGNHFKKPQQKEDDLAKSNLNYFKESICRIDSPTSDKDHINIGEKLKEYEQ